MNTGNPPPLGNPAFRDPRYETECPHGHGWYFYDDGCAVTGCENAPSIEGVVEAIRDPCAREINQLLVQIAQLRSALRRLANAKTGRPEDADEMMAAFREAQRLLGGGG